MSRIDPRRLFVRPGELVLPAWNRLVEFGRTLTIYSGPGILVSPRIGGGVTISARAWVKNFDHPWKTTLNGTSAEINPGLVNGLEPLIDGIPMSGKDNGARPRLDLDDKLFDKTGRSWISIELTRTDSGKIDKLRIVQTDIYLGQDGGTLEHKPRLVLEPIAMLKRARTDKGGVGKLSQVRFFNVTGWRVNLKNPGGPRHFFA
jgi:hypothetical protein